MREARADDQCLIRVDPQYAITITSAKLDQGQTENWGASDNSLYRINYSKDSEARIRDC